MTLEHDQLSIRRPLRVHVPRLWWRRRKSHPSRTVDVGDPDVVITRKRDPPPVGREAVPVPDVSEHLRTSPVDVDHPQPVVQERDPRSIARPREAAPLRQSSLIGPVRPHHPDLLVRFSVTNPALESDLLARGLTRRRVRGHDGADNDDGKEEWDQSLQGRHWTLPLSAVVLKNGSRRDRAVAAPESPVPQAALPSEPTNASVNPARPPRVLE